jgi:5-methylcytosine-specific restriction endonuclease McrA
LRDKIKQAQELLRHQSPSGDLAIVFERALDLLIAERRKQHFGQVRKPRADRVHSSGKSNPRYVPRAVRREVVERDAGQCTFVGAHGRRCSARGHLEFDHVIPFARGGLTTADNLRLRCRSHNVLLAERIYGRDFMQQRARRRHAPSPIQPPPAKERQQHGRSQLSNSPSLSGPPTATDLLMQVGLFGQANASTPPATDRESLKQHPLQHLEHLAARLVRNRPRSSS